MQDIVRDELSLPLAKSNVEAIIEAELDMTKNNSVDVMTRIFLKGPFDALALLICVPGHWADFCVIFDMNWFSTITCNVRHDITFSNSGRKSGMSYSLLAPSVFGVIPNVVEYDQASSNNTLVQ